MGVNKLRSMWLAGSAARGGWCAIPSSFSAEIVASIGFDYVCVDMQHGLADFGSLVPMLQAVAIHGPTPLVRVPVGEMSTAQRAFDAGAEGVIFPLVSTREQARAAAEACRYPPAGLRSYGPIRSRMYLGADARHANSEVLCIVMIETQEAIDNLEEIVACPGIDAVYVGPNDLSLALGVEIGSDDPALAQVIGDILTVCQSHSVPAGIHTTSGAAAAAAIERGFSMATVTSDAAILSASYRFEFRTSNGRNEDERTGIYG